jgi:hypothetical protein
MEMSKESLRGEQEHKKRPGNPVDVAYRLLLELAESKARSGKKREITMEDALKECRRKGKPRLCLIMVDGPDTFLVLSVSCNLRNS